MSMAEVIESIKRDAFKQVTPISAGSNEKIECSQLEDEPVIVADSKKTADILKSCFTDKAHEIKVENAIKYLKEISWEIGTASAECLSEKEGKKMRECVAILENRIDELER